MRRLYFLLFTNVVLTSLISLEVSAHKEQIHQYLAIQGFELLKKYYPGLANSVLANHLGYQWGYDSDCDNPWIAADNKPWTDALVTTGAFREDCEDVVYGHLSDITNTNSHFWDADRGDEYEGTFPPLDIAYPNAFQKARQYVNGGWEIYLSVSMFNPPGEAPCHAVLFVRYNSLIDLYKTGRIYLDGYQTYDMRVFHYNEPYELTDEILEGSGYTANALKDIMVFQILGRLIHILGDMGVPAHAHDDAHCSICPGGSDVFEQWEQGNVHVAPHFTEESAETAYNNNEPFLDVYGAVPSQSTTFFIRYLFYTTNQMADRFPSNDVDGDEQYDLAPSSIDNTTDDYSTLSIIAGATLPVDHGAMPTDPASFDTWGREINRFAFRYSIRAIAGLYYWFAKETDMLDDIKVQNSFAGGTVNVDGLEVSSPIIHTYYYGDNVTIQAHKQLIEGYYRVFRFWERIAKDRSTEQHADSTWNFRVMTSGEYTAHFVKQFNISCDTVVALGEQSGGTYDVIYPNGSFTGVSHWICTFDQDYPVPITITVHPDDPNLILACWVDDKQTYQSTDGSVNTSPTLTLHPTDHVTGLHAVFKKHLVSSVPDMFVTNTQRKVTRTQFIDPTYPSMLTSVYESDGAIWETWSTDNGQNWSPEQVIGGMPNSGTTFRNPTIEAVSLGTYLNMFALPYVAWESVTSGSSGYSHQILLKDPGQTTSYALLPTPFTTSEDQLTTPVMTSTVFSLGGKQLTILWKDLDALKWETMYVTTSPPTYPASASMDNYSTSNSFNPAIASRIINQPVLGESQQICVVWEERGSPKTILYAQGCPSPDPVIWNVKTIVPSGTSEENTLPTIVTDASGNACIAWIYINNSDPANPNSKVKFQRRDLNGDLIAGTEQEFTTGTGPSNLVSSVSLSNHAKEQSDQNALTLSWTVSDGRVFVCQYGGIPPHWEGPYALPSTSQGVSLNESKLSFDEKTRYALSIASVGPPYTISSLEVPFMTTIQGSAPISWNMLSVPVLMNNYSKPFVYPNASSPAFAYQGGYVTADPLASGPGYWVKFDQDNAPVSYHGLGCTTLSTPLVSGWNMIGSVSTDISADNMASEPDGILISEFYGYTSQNGYTPAATLEHGKGYWIRTSQAGKLVFNVKKETGSRASGTPPNRIYTGDPPIPELLSPTDSSTNMPQALTLTWADTSQLPVPAEDHRVQVAHDKDFTAIDIDRQGIIGTSLQVGPLQAGRTYFWRVAAYYGGSTLGWPQARSFSIPNLPSVPTLLSPSNGVNGQSTVPTLAWNASQEAATYRLQVSLNSGFTSLSFEDSNITTTSRQLNALASGTTYYWRVNAKNAVGISSWSSEWSFETAAPPSAPILSSPLNGSTGQPTTVFLTWSAPEGATSYTVQFSPYSDFSSSTLNIPADTTRTGVGSLTGLTTYYWRVNATNYLGTSPWSETWSFTTEAPPLPSTVTLSYPGNGATDIPITTTLQWNAASNATSYHLQVSTVSSFSSTVVNDSTLATLSRSVSLNYSRTYYWRVRGKNMSGSGPWSSVWNFTTADNPCPIDPDLAISPVSLDQVTISDAHGNSQSLFIQNEHLDQGTGPRNDEMPPEGPVGVFDARFQSGKMKEHVSSNDTTIDLPIKLKDVAYPITFKWNFHAANAVTYHLTLNGHVNGNGVGGRIPLSDSGSITLQKRGNGGNLVLQPFGVDPCHGQQKTAMHKSGEDQLLPKSYELKQNAPNPFNPTTRINYALPENAHVTLKVYNMLGQQVRVLVDELQSAGYKMVEFDGNSLATGVYFYRFQAGPFSKIMKMVMIK